MKNNKNNITFKKKVISASASSNVEATTRLYQSAFSSEEQLFNLYQNTDKGYNEQQANKSRDEYGENIITHGKQNPMFKRLFDSFINPFTIVLLVLAIISTFTDIILAEPEDKNPMTVIIITVMVLISGILRFVQETRSGNVADKLLGMIHTTANVLRDGTRQEISLDEIVVGDIVYLSAGDMIPADMRVLTSKDLFISQSALTGESEPVEKISSIANEKLALTEMNNLVFMGSNVISGSCKAIVIAVGNETMIGAIAKTLNVKPPKTTFEKGVNSVSWILIRFMLVMVPIVLFVNGFTKGNWMQALLFAISIAVGLTPEMLPMIVTTSLAKGALTMSKHDVIIKNLNSIQNLGSMDILCTDKTGTLTQDKVVLEYHLNIEGKEDDRVLRHGFLNSYFQTGLKNLIDIAVIEKQKELGADALINKYSKVDEIPFDFERRRMSVVVKDDTGKTQLVTKGAVEEMLKCCKYADVGGKILPLTDEVTRLVLQKSDELNDQGMRVIAVAQKTNPAPVGEFSVKDESEMVLIGFLALLDPPKATTKDALNALKEYGVNVKILTGDNDKVTAAICKQVGLDADKIILGEQLEEMNDEQLAQQVEEITVFAKLSPAQKARVVQTLRDKGHTVGYMGDGINDASAMKVADIGISVDTAVDIAKESASVVLLQKDLTVLEQGVIEGRKTYANMIKYIKMTASSNFGNMLSVLAASAFLPFLPMASIQLILLNLIYDISCTAIPWDNVDEDYLKIPRKWQASDISKFMLWFGPTSSIFDILTYALMYFVICPRFTVGLLYPEIYASSLRDLYESVFQTGWFIESMWTQSLVIHMIRTNKLPFIESTASLPVSLLSLFGISVITIIPFTPIAEGIGLTELPTQYFLYLAMIVSGYMLLVTIIKKIYIKKYRELL